MSEKELLPLPKELEEQMAAFRRIAPPENLVSRSFDALPARKMDAALTKAPKQEGRRSIAHFLGLRAAPVLIAAAAAGYFLFGQPKGSNSGFDVSSERTVVVSANDDGWTELELQTHHHADHPAVVHVEVPTHVSVRFANENGQPLEQSCTAERCVHRFTHLGKNGMPLRVAVAHPGRYEIHVRHESEKARLRERFVLHAAR